MTLTTTLACFKVKFGNISLCSIFTCTGGRALTWTSFQHVPSNISTLLHHHPCLLNHTKGQKCFHAGYHNPLNMPFFISFGVMSLIYLQHTLLNKRKPWKFKDACPCTAYIVHSYWELFQDLLMTVKPSAISVLRNTYCLTHSMWFTILFAG